MDEAWDVAVVGGGLSGLAAATYLGRKGLSVVVIEKARELGGRARTTVEQGFSLNLGAHAVYRNGAAWAVLDELSVPRIGGVPAGSGAVALTRDGVHALPTGLLSMLTTGLLGLGGKLEISKVLATLGGIDATTWARRSAVEWIESAVTAREARAFLAGFVRLSTYAGDLERLSAGAAITQLQQATKHNVLYVDGGWQTLVDALRDRATGSGATILTGGGVARVERWSDGGSLRTERRDDGGSLRAERWGDSGSPRAERPGIEGSGRDDRTADGKEGGFRVVLGEPRSAQVYSSADAAEARSQGPERALRVRAVVLATGPHAAAAMVPDVPEVARIAAETIPMKVATLDVALARSPRPDRTFGLGTDRPTYVSVHSAIAKLSPEGGAVVHAMTYRPSGDARTDERDVEEAMDAVQPGWREHVVHRRFLPAMIASNDLPAAARGGLEGRPDVAVESAPGLFLAGDWVGPTGMLLDAALASARRSAMACAAHVESR